MSRPLMKINELKREYLKCNNPLKDEIVSKAIADLKLLTQQPTVN